MEGEFIGGGDSLDFGIGDVEATGVGRAWGTGLGHGGAHVFDFFVGSGVAAGRCRLGGVVDADKDGCIVVGGGFGDMGQVGQFFVVGEVGGEEFQQVGVIDLMEDAVGAEEEIIAGRDVGYTQHIGRRRLRAGFGVGHAAGDDVAFWMVDGFLGCEVTGVYQYVYQRVVAAAVDDPYFRADLVDAGISHVSHQGVAGVQVEEGQSGGHVGAPLSDSLEQAEIGEAQCIAEIVLGEFVGRVGISRHEVSERPGHGGGGYRAVKFSSYAVADNEGAFPRAGGIVVGEPRVLLFVALTDLTE